MAENRTKPTAVGVEDFLDKATGQRRDEALKIIEIMQNISGEKPVMWGPSIIGFGTRHYRSEAGREGDIPLLGFSPRKNNLTLYFYEGFNQHSEALAKLGKHKISMGCLYINRLADVDLATLHDMLEASFALAKPPQKAVITVEDYIANLPSVALPKFNELRVAAQRIIPQAKEVMSYGIVGYKTDDKRARVFISGWKDHVAVYPIPKNETLRTALEPYIKGKGTLWFKLTEPLPMKLIEKVMRELVK